jgi:hypothetical protein
VRGVGAPARRAIVERVSDSYFEIGGVRWRLHGARLGFAHVTSPEADWSLSARTDGPPRPWGTDHFLIAGYAEPPPRSLDELRRLSVLRTTVEDSGDVLDFELDGRACCVAPPVSALIRVELVVPGSPPLVTLAYDGPFLWWPDDAEAQPRDGALRVTATLEDLLS